MSSSGCKIAALLACLWLLMFSGACGGKTTTEPYFPESSLKGATSSRSLPADVSDNQGPSIFVQMGHTNTGYTANTVARFTPDGRFILTGSIDGVVKLWETETGMEVRTFRCRDRVSHIAVSPDGRYMASGDESHGENINVWEISSGKKIRSFSIEAINGPPVVFCHGGGTILGGGKDALLRLWDISSGGMIREYRLFPETGADLFVEVSSLVLTPDGKKAIAGYHYHNANPDMKPATVGVWDIDTGENLLSFNNGGDSTVALAALLDEPHLLSGVWGVNNADVWDIDSGALVRSYPTGGTSAISVSARGRYALFGGYMNFKLVELSTGKEIRKIDKDVRDWVKSIEFSPDGKYALIGDQVPQPKIWDLASGAFVRALGGYAGRTMTAQIAETGNVLMIGHGYSNSVSLWDYRNGIRLKKIDNDPGCLTSSAALSRDGAKVAFSGWNTASENSFVSIWDARTGRKSIELHPPEKSIMHAASPVFTGDGRRIIWSTGAEVFVNDAENGSEINRFRIGYADIRQIALDPSERYILTNDDLGNSSLVDLKTARVLKTYKRSKCAFSRDGRKLYALAVGSERSAVLTETDLTTLIEKNLFEFGFDGVVPEGLNGFSNYIEKLIAGSDDSHLFFYDSYKKLVYKLDLGKLDVTARYAGHTDDISNVDISPGGTVLCSSSHDGTTRVWDPETGKELARFIGFSDGEWVAVTPEGYFNASAKGARYLNVRVGNQVYSIDEYREAFYRPDLVKVALSGGSLQEFRNFADVKPPPAVAIVDAPPSVAADNLTVKLNLADNGGGIGDIRLYLNGTAVVMDSRGIQVAASGAGALVRNYTLNLAAGRNVIKAVAFNADNTVQSKEATLEVTAAIAAAGKPSLYALVIGIDEFQNPKLKLNYTVADAELFASVLAGASAGIFKNVDIRKLTTREATTNLNILEQIKSFASLRPEDIFVFYIASHGTVDDGEYFLITSNVGSLRTEKLRIDAISQNMLKEAIANVPATKKLIVIDTCNAGALGDALQAVMLTRGMSEDTALKILGRAVGSTILSASTSVQEALEGYRGHGLFTYVLAEGLKGKADKAKSGYVKTTELADYVDNEVPVLAESVFNRAQYPTISISGQAFPIGKAQ